MRRARDLAHQICGDTCAFDDTLGWSHSWRCDEATLLIEADRIELCWELNAETGTNVEVPPCGGERGSQR